MIYLYVKTHNKTGLKYLGKTTKKDPHKYLGSGTYWKAHLAIHGNDYNTIILKECQSKEELVEWGKYYSKLWNVAESAEWANLKDEEGDGGFCSNSVTPEANAKRSNTLRGRTITEEHRKKLSEANKGKYWHSDETKRLAAKKASEKLKGRPKPEGFGDKVGARLKGTTMRDDSKEKMRQAWTAERKLAQAERRRKMNAARPVIICPQCGKQGTHSGNMRRYHFDNCSSTSTM